MLCSGSMQVARSTPSSANTTSRATSSACATHSRARSEPKANFSEDHGRSGIITSMRICLPLIAVLVLSVFAHPKADKSSASDPVLVGAGDIASCDDLAGAYATAKLIEKMPNATVFAAGDLAY